MAQHLRLYLPADAAPGTLATPWGPAGELARPPDAVRHVQVRRLQPGDTLSLFDGAGQEWLAELLAMGRSTASVRLLNALTPPPELPWAVTLAVAVPANDRMDTVVEKATELGAAGIQPLLTQHSVLRLDSTRASKRVAHWHGVAAAAAEQCGRAWVPQIGPWCSLSAWLATLPPASGPRWLLAPGARDALIPTRLPAGPPPAGQTRWPVLCLSGPEGGLSAAEEALAEAQGFVPLSLGPRVLRADTAPLAVMAWASLHTASVVGPPDA
ncbi:MAG: 16S rRNA (uracil(1498)-N(3))-methyltransferase [Rubrivivax sp.]